MAKLTLEQKIAKLRESIQKEESAIEESKGKIKEWKSELKRLTAEKEQAFANEILKLMKENGISQSDLMEQLKSAKPQTAEDETPTNSSPNDVFGSQTSVSDFSKPDIN